MEFQEREEEMGTLAPSYDSQTNSSCLKMSGELMLSQHHLPGTSNKPSYKECLKNHAVRLGSHAVDGCGEFLAAGPEGTLDALKCAACNCHRNFHRKEDYPGGPLFLPCYQTPSGYVHLTHHRPSTACDQEDDLGGGGKRFRTKFSRDQKEKMLELAEKLGWRIQKHDEAAVQQFCEHSGVKRHVLKVWMHNNKHTLRNKP